MAGFYDILAKYYNDLFSPPEEKIDQIKALFADIPGNKLLDLGCGAGAYVFSLSEIGYETFGLDYSSSMVAQAKEEAPLQVKERIVVGDMKEAYPFKKELLFDGIFCIGNTLVHLEELSQVRETIKNAYSRLRSGGKILIQILNYDNPNIVNKQFPIKGNSSGKVKFYRKYIIPQEGAKDKIIFQTKLKIENDGEVFEDSDKLMMLGKEQIAHIMTELGFKEVEFYSDFKRTPWNINGENTVVVGKKE